MVILLYAGSMRAEEGADVLGFARAGTQHASVGGGALGRPA
jgi:hypothetical protein